MNNAVNDFVELVNSDDFSRVSSADKEQLIEDYTEWDGDWKTKPESLDVLQDECEDAMEDYKDEGKCQCASILRVLLESKE